MGMVFGPGMTFAKCAILALYLRIFQVSRTLRFLIWVGVFVICSSYLVAIPLFTYYCTPQASEHWNLMLLEKCKKNGVLALIQGVVGVVTDLYIFVLPLPTVLRLRLPRCKKIGVMIVFAAGLLGIAAAALSLVYRVKNWQRTDTTWNSARVCISV
jgi:multisubunit Na+/H+ antiporter MnhB subunit